MDAVSGFNVSCKKSDGIIGWVSNENQLDNLIETHRLETGAAFVSWHDNKTRKAEVSKTPRLLWHHPNLPINGPAFSLGRHVIKLCQYGKGRKRNTSNQSTLDYDEAEIGAVTAEFPDGKILMCAFHREQAWERWSRSEDNVPSEDREEFLRHLRAVADAPSEETLQEAIQSLEEKSFYRGSLRRYVESKWLSVKESWCRACIAPGFHLPVTTNNGVETLNKSLKHFYLKLSSSASLSNLVQIIFKDFLPDLYQTYLMLNFRSTSNFKPYQGIPSYLHDRPHHIVQHMLKRLSKGEEDFQSSDISLNTVGLYTVKSDSRKYTVSLGSESAYPDCSCDDFRRNFLPCKHMFAVFTFTNSDFLDLPLLYRSNPLLTLDTSSVKTHSGLCALTRQPVTEEAISSTKEDSIDTVKVQRNVLSKLKHIQTLVYLCKDNNTLQNANDLLEEVATALKENVPHDANLPLGPSAKLRKLPTRRKYFRRHGKYQRRVGAKAQKMRAAAVLEIGNMARKKPMKAKIHSKTRTPPSLDGPVLTDNPPSLDGSIRQSSLTGWPGLGRQSSLTGWPGLDR
ncbi:uncharacterized protein [Argopecten irradians]|uniref:uncharacterized protein n=1 Tax=Argopecten irradians TaxID=31199 RepID=UPI0037220878